MGEQPRWEFPTLSLALAVYAGWLLFILGFHELPWVARPILGGLLVAWHGSLQHEFIHGHPSPYAWFNRMLGFPPLALGYSYELYRRSHVTHHECPQLTDPALDTESFYMTAERWQQTSRPMRWLWTSQQTLLGRMLFGPVTAQMQAFRASANRPGRDAGLWARHACIVTALLALVYVLGEVTPVEYLLCAAYPGMSLTLVRSFYEHRPGPTQASRSAIVESCGPFGWLFLFNGFHAVHHQHPDLPWYAIPGYYRTHRAAVLTANESFVFRSYAELFRKFLVRPKDSGVLPSR